MANPEKDNDDSKTVVVLFAAGAGLIVATFTYGLMAFWRPTFDPLVTATMIGVGLLLIVIYERLGRIHEELRTINGHLKHTNGVAMSVPPSVVENDSRADAKATAHAR
jgi:hypothetical protein